MSELRRLAVLNPIGEMGGAEISLVEMIRGLKGDPHVTVIVPSFGPLSDASEKAGAAVIHVPMPATLERTGEVGNSRALGSALRSFPQLLTYSGALVRSLRRHQFDLLLTNGIKSHVTGTVAAAIAGIPVAWHLRDSLEERTLSRRILSMLSFLASGSIAISEYVADEMGPAARSRLRPSIIFNPVDKTRFNRSAIPPDDLVKPSGEVWFAAIGAITPLKGQDLFLDAASIVLRSGLNARFFIVGGNFYETDADTSFEDNLMQMASREPMEGRVHFLGRRSDIDQLMTVFDVIVHSNRGPEGLGRVILEAMSAAKPVIAFDHGGPAEIITSGVTGELVSRGNVGLLAARMIELGEHPDLRIRLGLAAHEWSKDNLDPVTISSRFRRALEKIAASKDT